MHSKAFRSFSSVMASRSTAPAHKNICQLYIMFSEENSQIIWLNSQTEEYEAYYTLVCAVVKHIEGLHSCRTPLLVTKDQIDPIMKVRWHILRLLKNRIECWNCLVLTFLHYLLAWWLGLLCSCICCTERLIFNTLKFWSIKISPGLCGAYRWSPQVTWPIWEE